MTMVTRSGRNEEPVTAQQRNGCHSRQGLPCSASSLEIRERGVLPRNGPNPTHENEPGGWLDPLRPGPGC